MDDKKDKTSGQIYPLEEKGRQNLGVNLPKGQTGRASVKAQDNLKFWDDVYTIMDDKKDKRHLAPNTNNLKF